MRPRLLHLGSNYRLWSQRWDQASFNEAEAFTPRIRMARRSGKILGSSFNEAEAFTPRIRRNPNGLLAEKARLQ